jgi:ABC-type transporter MlaC component
MTRSTRITSNTATSRSALAALALLTAFAAASRAADQSPSQVVDGLAGQVIPILRNASLSSDQKRDRIEQIAYQAMDFETLSKLVLARNWSKFHPRNSKTIERPKRTVGDYGAMPTISQREGRFSVSWQRETVTTVHTKILRGGHSDDIVVDYRLRQRDGQSKIIDGR